VSQAVKPARTRRAKRAAETQRRILDAATELFTDVGFSGATIEAIAAKADVAVETVYSRFRNKANLLEAILGPAISGREEGGSIFDRPEFGEIRACTDQRLQVRLLARFSRDALQRTDQIHRILSTASAVDANAAALEEMDGERRHKSQRVYIDLLLANGPLRHGLTPQTATDSYAALASPTTYAFFVHQLGRSPEYFERWLADSLERLLLP
jgi:AcrR family transcriptional regulator